MASCAKNCPLFYFLLLNFRKQSKQLWYKNNKAQWQHVENQPIYYHTSHSFNLIHWAFSSQGPNGGISIKHRDNSRMTWWNTMDLNYLVQWYSPAKEQTLLRCSSTDLHCWKNASDPIYRLLTFFNLINTLHSLAEHMDSCSSPPASTLCSQVWLFLSFPIPSPPLSFSPPPPYRAPLLCLSLLGGNWENPKALEESCCSPWLHLSQSDSFLFSLWIFCLKDKIQTKDQILTQDIHSHEVYNQSTTGC